MILATNIAETSITVNGIKYVVDTGMVKVCEACNARWVSQPQARTFNSRIGLEMLGVVPVSKAQVSCCRRETFLNALQAKQRMGRAGRESSGTCFRLYTEAAYEGLAVRACRVNAVT